MSAGRDFLLFIFFLVALGIAWFFTGGPTRAISHAGWFLNGGIPVPSVDLSATGTAATSGGNDTSYQNTGGQDTSLPNYQPSGWNYFFSYRPGLGSATSIESSPYAPYVKFSSGNVKTADPAAEYVVIQIDSRYQGSLTVTGWTLENGKGTRTTIGSAADIPFLGGMNSQSPVYVRPGARVVIVTGSSPNGVSFRVNKCTGYFTQFQNYKPSLATECPTPVNEAYRHPDAVAGNENCQNFVEDIPQCTITLTQIPGNVGGLCQSFILNTLSYNGCIQEHQSDPDFYRNEWRMYLNRSGELWSNSHDVIRLYDENGKIVGQISY